MQRRLACGGPQRLVDDLSLYLAAVERDEPVLLLKGAIAECKEELNADKTVLPKLVRVSLVCVSSIMEVVRSFAVWLAMPLLIILFACLAALPAAAQLPLRVP